MRRGPDLYRRMRRFEREMVADRRGYQAKGIPTREWRRMRGPYWRARRLEVLRTVPGAAKPTRAPGFYSPSLPTDAVFKLHKGECVEVTPRPATA